MDTASRPNRITEGVIWQQLLIFFFPVLLGNFFQQLYNTADAMIVGRFIGKEALAAVGGSAGMLTQLIVGFFVGLSAGAGVVISQHYGAKQEDMVEAAVHTAVAFSLLSGLIFMIAGLALTPTLLRVMKTPDDVMEPSVTYIYIYFAGIIPNLIYNMGASILRAVGDSRRPLYFLIAACLTNIVLDLVFVVWLRMGIAGAALATILSQLISAVLVTICLTRATDMHRLVIRRIRLDPRIIRRIIRIGFPTGLQSVMYSLSNIIIQTAINALGTDSMSAWAAYYKLDAIFWMILNSFSIAVTTFTGQNFGARKMDRVHKGIRICMCMTLATSVLLSLFFYYWGIYSYQLFTTDQNVISIGIRMTRYLSRWYTAACAIDILSGALRGVGDSLMPMILSMVGVCGLHMAWILVAVPKKPDMYTIMFGYPLAWIITTAMFVIYYLFFSALKHK
ncbi:MAG: MATE family efflux transporter [Clostridiales bacterium]|nr:MATE family efflux transporter [Clostridiales bacterium]